MRSREELPTGESKIEEFLSGLAVRGQVAASTQNQAFNALLFLYLEVLGADEKDCDQHCNSPQNRLPAAIYIQCNVVHQPPRPQGIAEPIFYDSWHKPIPRALCRDQKSDEKSRLLKDLSFSTRINSRDKYCFDVGFMNSLKSIGRMHCGLVPGAAREPRRSAVQLLPRPATIQNWALQEDS